MVLWRLLSNPSPTLVRSLSAYRKLDLANGPPTSVHRPLHKQAKRLNAVELARLAERYQQGATVYELAAELQIARTTVAIRLKAQGVQLRNASLSETDIARAIELHGRGLSLAKVGHQLGRDSSGIWLALKRAGVRMRDTHGRDPLS